MFRTLALFFGAGVLYYIWIRLGGAMIPCPVRALTGYKCPGCGITHMILCLLKLDVSGAYRENPFLLVTLPLLAYLIGSEFRRQLKGETVGKLQKLLQIAYLAALLVFGIWRNI